MKKAIIRATVFLGLLGCVTAVKLRETMMKDLVKPVKVGEGMWLQESKNVPYWGSNVAWIEFDTFVVVIDSAFPRGAEEALKNIKATTNNKPIKYVLVTHYHADHSFGSGVFKKEGATIVAHENARGTYVEKNGPGYEKRQKESETAAKYPSVIPEKTFKDQFIIEEGKRRAEIKFLGHAHTSGCVWTWLPRERVLFSGDACVNGNFNYMGDCDSKSWIEALTKAQALDPKTVVPGHGAASDGSLLETQKHYFVELRRQVGELLKQGKSKEEIVKTVDIPKWREWTGETKMDEADIRVVTGEMTR